MSNGNTVWTTQGTQILCDGKRAVLNGVCYSPTPHIYATFTPNIGDWFHSKCGVLWRSERPDDRGDLKQMKALGINHLRVYFWWEWQWPTENADDWVKRRGWREDAAPRFDHQDFLDTCAENGISVAIGLAVDGSHIWSGDASTMPQYRDLYVDTAVEIGKKWGNHPAVMGLCIGNEQNQPARNVTTGFWTDLSAMASAFKRGAPDKLTMIAFQNDAKLFDYDVDGKKVAQVFYESFDVYGLNIYGEPTESISNFRLQVVAAEAGRYARPLIVSEWGVGGGKNIRNADYDRDGFPKSVILADGSDHPIGPLEGPPYGNAKAREFNPAEFETKVQDLKRYWSALGANQDIVAGSQYFAWSDEWWKNYTDQKIVAAYEAGNPRLIKDEWGRFQFPYFENENEQQGYHGRYEWRFLTRVDQQDGSASPDWPEEFWGLYAIGPNPNGLPGWNEYGMYNADTLRARPTVEALGACYRQQAD